MRWSWPARWLPSAQRMAARSRRSSPMDKPLGHNIGNALEVAESMAVLQGKGPHGPDRGLPCSWPATCWCWRARAICPAVSWPRASLPTAPRLKSAARCLPRRAATSAYCATPTSSKRQKYSYELTAPADGYIYKNDVEKIGNASVLLGAGRIKKEDSIDFAAGITMHKKLGDYVKAGRASARSMPTTKACLPQPRKCTAAALSSAMSRRRFRPSSTARVTSDGVERF